MIHTYARDRAPADCAIHVSTWRYRWNCGCGDAGTWRRSEELAHQDWAAHVRRREEMERGGVSSEQIVHEALIARIEQLKAQVAALETQQAEAREALWELATCVNNLSGLVNEQQRQAYCRAIARANKLHEEMRGQAS